MTDESKPDKKIIVDGDWKSQVEAEKEELRKKPPDSADSSGPTLDARDKVSDELPPASFPMLVSMLATQALAALGQLPDPVEDEPVVHLSWAKHHIDTLALLEEKTKGNLTDDEARMLADSLHQLRMVYVAAKTGSLPSRE